MYIFMTCQMMQDSLMVLSSCTQYDYQKQGSGHQQHFKYVEKSLYCAKSFCLFLLLCT